MSIKGQRYKNHTIGILGCCHWRASVASKEEEHWYYITAVLNRRPPGCIRPTGLLFVAPELLFLYVFWLGQHVYTRTCLHAKDTQTAVSLTAASATFNFHFHCRSSSYIYIWPVVRDWKWRVHSILLIKVDSENLLLKEVYTLNLHFFSLQLGQD